jgi:hypothetical protein
MKELFRELLMEHKLPLFYRHFLLKGSLLDYPKGVSGSSCELRVDNYSQKTHQNLV